MSTEHSNRGLVKTGRNRAEVIDLPLPRLRDDCIRIRTMAVALNPADWQNLDEEFEPGSQPLLNGHDAAGIVEDIGKDVLKPLRKGDRVMSGAHGVNVTYAEDGAFAQYIQTKGDVSIRIPSYMSSTDAATLPCGLMTVGLAFYKHLRLPFPPATVEEGTWILIYGGSTATGTLAIQFAKLSGLKVVTTCSPRNHDLVQSLGADFVYDYRDSQCAAKIRDLTANSLTLVFDTIATPEAAKICGDAMSSNPGGIYCNLMGVDPPRDDITTIFFLGYTGLGRPYIYEGEEWPVVPEDYELNKRFSSLVEDLLEKRIIKPHPTDVREGGLDAIPNGMEDIRQGKVSGQKLVYIIGGEK